MPKAPKKKNGRAQTPRKPQPEKTNGKSALSKESAFGHGPVSASFPIVAIGASAGGLEAFSSLLRALPSEPGLGLVFIPHLDPTHESAMVELLSRTTRLPVRQATEGTRVLVNTVYVLPPNSDMTISSGILHLGARETTRGHHLPIDSFFASKSRFRFSAPT